MAKLCQPCWRLVAFAVIPVILWSPFHVAGQEQALPDRGGFTLLLDAGLGLQHDGYFGETEAGFAGVNLGIGGFLTRDLALVFRVSGTTVSYDGLGQTSGVGGPTAQLWLNDRLHLEGGVGALLAAGAVSGGALLFTLLKALFGRARPTVVPMLVQESAPSFPSGHATQSAVVYLSVAVMLARFESSPMLRAYLLTVGLLVTGVVGLTRVLLGVDYPTDVLAGWSLGLAWAAVGWLIAVWFGARPGGGASARAED